MNESSPDLLGRLGSYLRGLQRRSPFGQRPASEDVEGKGEAEASGSRAYNLVVLAVAVTLLNVWVASTLPLWSHQIQRDKEAELIFRGLQYAEAIRIFQQRYNRYPTNLKELIEVEPRCIRQLWENPMREDGRWGLIPVGVGGEIGRGGNQPQGGGLRSTSPRRERGGGAGGRDGASGGADDFDDGLGDDGFGEDPFGSGTGGDGEDQNAGVILSADPNDSFGEPPKNVAIRGVFSPTSLEAVHVFLGKENVREWQFTIELVSAQKQGLPDNPGLVTPFLAWEIGRPWPPGVTPQVPQPSSEAQQGQQGQNVGGGDVPVNSDGNPVIGVGGGRAAGGNPAGGGQPNNGGRGGGRSQ